MLIKTILIRDGLLVSSTALWKVDVLLRDGVVEKLAYHDEPDYALPTMADQQIDEVIEAEGLLLFPGFIDCHVHFREPGYEYKATMRSEAASARAGGVTTVCEMPNTNPPVTTIAALADKVRRAAEIDECDLHFFFGVTESAHVQTVRELWTGTSAELRRLKARCAGVKIFLDHSTGNQKASADVVHEIFALCGELQIPLVAHCEDPEMNAKADASVMDRGIASHSLRRPPESEAHAIGHAITLARAHRTPLHIAHLSTKQGIELIARAKREGFPVTCEVAPHHLFLTVDDYDTLGTLAKMNPPLRTAEHRDALWQGIAEGIVDCISTDHAPHALEEKKSGDPLRAPSGVPGVETMIPLLLSVAAGAWPHTRLAAPHSPLSFPDIARLCFEAPNRIFNLGKNEIKEGTAATVVLVDPKKRWTIRGTELHSKCGWTPYEGWTIQGKVMRIL